MCSLREVQLTQLEILRATLEILKENGIKAYLAYGSCLGAVRHNGFIPWDDDIDICLFREDYEKARNILIENLPSKYCYCDRHTIKDYPHCFAKVCQNGTAFVHASDMHINTHHGVYIDLMPIDSAPSPEQSKAFFKKVKRLKQKLTLTNVGYKKGGKLRPIYHLPIIFFGHILFNKKRIQEKLDSLIQSFNKSNPNSEYVCDSLQFYKLFKREWFGEGTLLNYEDMQCLVPKEYDLYLKALYNNYMQLPPEEKRISHHDIVYINLNEEFKNR